MDLGLYNRCIPYTMATMTNRLCTLNLSQSLAQEVQFDWNVHATCITFLGNVTIGVESYKLDFPTM